MRSRLRTAAATVLKAFGPHSRRSTIGRNRAHIEIKKLVESELSAFTRAVKKELELPRVQWVEVNPALFRVVIAFEDDAFTIEELVAHVENAERTCGVHDAAFQASVPERREAGSGLNLRPKPARAPNTSAASSMIRRSAASTSAGCSQ
ncbi:MAG TPA: hypothetical protein VM686_09845, partial [Polyangiaceae bacterium]|nr:hypothetical protein [Polyangiaceae bacterium]